MRCRRCRFSSCPGQNIRRSVALSSSSLHKCRPPPPRPGADQSRHHPIRSCTARLPLRRGARRRKPAVIIQKRLSRRGRSRPRIRGDYMRASQLGAFPLPRCRLKAAHHGCHYKADKHSWTRGRRPRACPCVQAFPLLQPRCANSSPPHRHAVQPLYSVGFASDCLTQLLLRWYRLAYWGSQTAD